MILNKRCIFSILLIFLLLAGQRAPIHAQVDNRVPFKHRVGNPAPEANLFRIRGDFAIIGNTNLTRTTYSDSSDNSGNEMIFVDVDQDSSTLNSSSATLMFSQENESDLSCTDVLYAGLYWSGRAEMGKALTFEAAINTISGMSQGVDGMTWDVFRLDELRCASYVLATAFEYDSDYLMYPTCTFTDTADGHNI